MFEFGLPHARAQEGEISRIQVFRACLQKSGALLFREKSERFLVIDLQGLDPLHRVVFQVIPFDGQIKHRLDAFEFQIDRPRPRPFSAVINRW